MSSSLVSVTKYGSVVQLVRMLACHARGHGFESRQSRLWHLPLTGQESRLRKQESDEQRSQVRLLPAFQPENVGSSPAGVTISASSNGRTLVSDASNVSSILAAEICLCSSTGRAHA